MSIDEIKPLAGYLGRHYDIPVSLFSDNEVISVAMFWDTRVLGSLKMLDFETH